MEKKNIKHLKKMKRIGKRLAEFFAASATFAVFATSNRKTKQS